tara:strand:+ start:1134 stop:1688 length:555 start_codon:yes stop_codon:yes gene_type:complete
MTTKVTIETNEEHPEHTEYTLPEFKNSTLQSVQATVMQLAKWERDTKDWLKKYYAEEGNDNPDLDRNELKTAKALQSLLIEISAKKINEVTDDCKWEWQAIATIMNNIQCDTADRESILGIMVSNRYIMRHAFNEVPKITFTYQPIKFEGTQPISNQKVTLDSGTKIEMPEMYSDSYYEFYSPE